MEEATNNSVSEIVDLASKIQPVEFTGEDSTRRIALPPGWELSDHDIEKTTDHPKRRTGLYSLTDIDSFIGFINRHKSEQETVIYCNADFTKSTVLFKVFFNDHAPAIGNPGWRDFLATYKPELSQEWKTWIGKNDQRMNQLDFAKFIEQNLDDIAADVENMPTGQQLLEMALSFEATNDMVLKSSVRLQDGGLDMVFVDKSDQATMAKMKMFEKIAIGIPVFFNGTAYQVTARLRYRVNGGTAQFWYELIKPEKIIQDAVSGNDGMIEKIKKETGAPLFFANI